MEINFSGQDFDFQVIHSSVGRLWISRPDPSKKAAPMHKKKVKAYYSSRLFIVKRFIAQPLSLKKTVSPVSL